MARLRMREGDCRIRCFLSSRRIFLSGLRFLDEDRLRRLGICSNTTCPSSNNSNNSSLICLIARRHLGETRLDPTLMYGGRR